VKRVFLVLLLAACAGGGPPRSRYSPTEAADARAACSFGAGALPGLTLARDAPLGTQIPIDTFVLVMMENRSFDHLLGGLKATQPDADVAPPDATNPDKDGTPVARFHMTDLCFDDPNHGWAASHGEWNNGAMDGFVVNNYENNGQPADGKRAMGYYTEAEAPFLHALASTFAVADRSFCSLLGPTFPNRFYFAAATSYGWIGDHLFSEPRLNIIERMEAAHVTWHDYYAKLPTLGVFLDSFTKHLDNQSLVAQFAVDAAAGKLSQVNWVDPELSDSLGAERNDLHPPGDIQLGEQFLEETVRAAMASPQWPHMAIIVTFDEHGGLYDHVPPPAACPPDAIAPMLGAGDVDAKFDRLGVRVPTIVISPYARPHAVSHATYDHTSILRLLEARFGMPAMTARDANADPMFDLFDFQHAALLKPPALPTVTVDEAKKSDCIARYPSN
jgi:phospholipase C